MTIEELREKGLIAYEYIRGSHAYGLNVEGSDEDRGGVFILPQEYLYGLREKYVEQVSDEKNDTVFYEIGRWVELLAKSNPNAIESLFVPDDCIIGEIHPAVKYILDRREMFLTKKCFSSLLGYSVSQVSKAHGLNKKIVNPITERKDVLDFCYTFDKQGSIPMKEWLKKHNLDQKYCGLVNIPNMRDVYGVYYDLAAYFKFEDIDSIQWPNITFGIYGARYDVKIKEAKRRIAKKEFFHYSGIVNPDAESNDVRLSSIPKNEVPICFMSYNKNGYESHCREYKEYKEWEKNRNPVRYENNLGHNYDSKNMMHCMRLTRMGKELAQGKGFNVRRTDDREYLLDIRNHKYSYEEILNQVTKEKAEFDEALKTCELPDDIDVNKINEILINARKTYEKK